MSDLANETYKAALAASSKYDDRVDSPSDLFVQGAEWERQRRKPRPIPRAELRDQFFRRRHKGVLLKEIPNLELQAYCLWLEERSATAWNEYVATTAVGPGDLQHIRVGGEATITLPPGLEIDPGALGKEGT